MVDRAPLGIRECSERAGELGGLDKEYIPRRGDVIEAFMDRLGDAYVLMVLLVISRRAGDCVASFRDLLLPLLGGVDLALCFLALVG